MSYKLITLDAFAALVDIQGSLTPIVAEALSLNEKKTHDFVKLWRFKQLERAAISNQIDQAYHLGFVLIRHLITLSKEISLVYAKQCVKN